jgi:predicted PurR-regulated permease PerM
VRYAAGSAIVSGLVGLMVFGIAVVLGVPLAPVLGLWALLWHFVPQVGGFVAAVPLVFLALVEGTVEGLIALALYLVVQQIKNRILTPIVVGRALNLSPLVAITAVLVGGAAAGIVGAVLATPVVGAVRLVHQHLTSRHPPAGDDSSGRAGDGPRVSGEPAPKRQPGGPLEDGPPPERVSSQAAGGGGEARAPVET